MHKIWLFLQNYSAVFLFIVLELIALQFLVSQNQYHRNKFIKQTALIQGYVQQKQADVEHFFNLKKINKSLAEENASLRQQLTSTISARKDSIQNKKQDTLFTFQVAEVISNPIYTNGQYITINKGKTDSISIHDGVLTKDGIVGKVVLVNENYSLVMPVIHKDFKLSIIHQTTNSYGNLNWNGADFLHAQVTDITRSAPIAVGDTLVTSQYAKSFPEGSNVGTIESIDYDITKNFYVVKTKLSTNFRTLRHVYIIHNKDLTSIQALENVTP